MSMTSVSMSLSLKEQTGPHSHFGLGLCGCCPMLASSVGRVSGQKAKCNTVVGLIPWYNKGIFLPV